MGARRARLGREPGGTQARLLDERLFNLLRKLRSSLAINSLVAGLSIPIAVITYRQIVRPLGQLEALAGMVRETKNFGLRAISIAKTRWSACDGLQCHAGGTRQRA